MRKLFATVLILALVFTAAGAAFADTPADVAGSKYEEAVNALIEAGVVEGYPDGNFLPENSITRAEACKIAVLAAAEGNRVPAAALVETAAAAAEAFSDVAADFWGAGYIGYAVEQGIVDGYPDGTFRAGADVTYNEMIKMTVAALGYKAADLSGSWPDNYANKAKELGLLEGLSYTDGNAAAVRGDVAILACNGLNTAGAGEPEVPEKPEEPADQPTSPAGFDLKTYRGSIIGVIQSTSSLVNSEGEAVPAVNFLLGQKYAGDVPAKRGSAADAAITALDPADHLDGTLYALKMVKGEATEIATTSAGVTWLNTLKEIVPVTTSSAAFYMIDSIHKDEMMVFKNTSTGAVSYVLFEDTAVVYLLKKDRNNSYYELGDADDIRRHALVRMYDVTKDDDMADVVIIDKR